MDLARMMMLSIVIILAPMAHAEAEKITEISTGTYAVEFENFQWYKRLVIKMKGLDFLSWKEMDIAIESEYDTVSGSRTITSVLISHDGGKNFFSISKKSSGYFGTLDVDGPDEFTQQAVIAFLDIWNYFFDLREDELHSIVERVIKDDDIDQKIKADDKKIFRCYLKKEIGENVIITKTVPPENRKKYSKVEAIVSRVGKPMLQQIRFEMKGNETITLTLKPQ